MKPKASRLLLGSQVVLCITALPAMAADYDWDGPIDGDWNTAANWSADILPGATDNVFINVPGAAVKTITLSATPTFDTVNEVGLNRSGNGKLTNTSTLLVGVAGNGSTCVVNVADNATLTASTIQMETNSGATGAIRHSGGTVSTTSPGANSPSLGLVTGGFGSYRISGGSPTTDGTGQQHHHQE
jgi:hypothetical protein